MKYLALLVTIVLIIGLTPVYAQELSKVTSFDASASQAPEGLTVDSDGNIYVGLAFTGEIKKITPDGSVSTYTQLPSPGDGFMTGLVFDSTGALFVAFASFDENHGIWRVSSDGSSARNFAPLQVDGNPDGLPNALDFDDRGNLYASDSLGGQIWKIDQSGEVTVWKKDPLLMGVGPYDPPLPPMIGANGITFDDQGENLYVANTDLGRIVRIPVERDGSAGAATVYAEDLALLRGADGITFDREGNLYVSLLFQDKVVVISKDGAISTIAEGPLLQNPAVVRFGVDGKEDSLFITNFAMTRFIGLVSETPEPSILVIQIPSTGVDFTLIAIILGIILLIVAAVSIVFVSKRKRSAPSKAKYAPKTKVTSSKSKKK